MYNTIIKQGDIKMHEPNLDKQKLAPVGTDTIVNMVIERITSAIANGQFKAGQRLPSEYELVEDLKVSRNSLREAMKILSAMGIIDIRRGDGTYICSQVNPNFFDSIVYSLIFESSTDEEIIELRQVLDEVTLKLAMKKCTQEDIIKLQENIDAMRYYFKEGNIAEAAKLDYDFHLTLLDVGKNQFLARIVKGVYQIFEKSIEKNIRTEELFAKADEHHQDIVECLINQDMAHVEHVVSRSLSSWRNRVKKSEKNSKVTPINMK